MSLWIKIYFEKHNHLMKIFLITRQISYYNLNVKNKTGNNAFYWVIENYEIAKILLETGKLHIKDMKAQYIH